MVLHTLYIPLSDGKPILIEMAMDLYLSWSSKAVGENYSDDPRTQTSAQLHLSFHSAYL